MASNIRHSSASPKWGTSEKFVSIARRTLGRIDVDTFSEERWNGMIGAARFFDGSPGRDGFHDPWFTGAPRADFVMTGIAADVVIPAGELETALVNFPGDADGENGPRAWRIAAGYWERGLTDGIFWVGFSLNGLQTLQGLGVLSPLAPEFIRCIPDIREPYIPYVLSDKREAPSHPSFLCLLPSANPRTAELQVARFTEACAAIGAVF